MGTQPVLTQRALLLAKIESSYNVDASPTPALDAFLVSEADIQQNPNVLERNFYRPSLSPLPISIGRKLMQITFRHEIKGSGRAGVTPKLATLLRGCGFALTTIPNTPAATIKDPKANVANVGDAVTWTKAAAPASNFGRYGIRVVLGGASTSAKVRVTGNPHEADDATILPNEDFSALVMAKTAVKGTVVTVSDADPLAPTYTVTGTPVEGEVVVVRIGGVPVKITVGAAPTPTTVATDLTAAITALADARFSASSSGGIVTVTVTGGVHTVTTGTTAIPLGTSGAEVNMSFVGNLTLNDSWIIDLLQPGYHLTPISTGFESLTIHMFYDGMLHRLTGCIGSVSFQAEAGNFGTASFTFTGQYNHPEEVPLPTTSVFETSIPQQVELAQLMIGNHKRLRAQSFSVDMNIQVNPRESVSHPDGYDGVLYTSRAPQGGANPEMTFESVEPYWRNFAKASLLKFHGRVGTEPNNRVHFMSNTIQLSGLNYADRNNNRVYDLGFRFSMEDANGDDEIRIVFT